MLDAVLEEKTLEVKLELDCARAGLAIAAKKTMMAKILMTAKANVSDALGLRAF